VKIINQVASKSALNKRRPTVSIIRTASLSELGICKQEETRKETLPYVDHQHMGWYQSIRHRLIAPRMNEETTKMRKRNPVFHEGTERAGAHAGIGEGIGSPG
jgi:hypothetical protein